MQNDKITILIPCLNEEKGISKVINSFKRLGFHNIIVANGPSTDKTGEVAEKAGAKVFSVKKGKGNGFRDLLDQININEEMSYIMIDGDNSYSPDDLKKFQKFIDNKKVDVVMGRRPLFSQNYTGTLELILSISHIIANLFFAGIASVLFLEPLRDMCTGYWVFKGSALKKLKSRLTANGFELEADLFSSSKLLNLNIKRVDISYGKREGRSKIRFSDSYSIVKKLFTNRFASYGAVRSDGTTSYNAPENRNAYSINTVKEFEVN